MSGGWKGAKCEGVAEVMRKEEEGRAVGRSEKEGKRNKT